MAYTLLDEVRCAVIEEEVPALSYVKKLCMRPLVTNRRRFWNKNVSIGFHCM